jgi:hypothetical protein
MIQLRGFVFQKCDASAEYSPRWLDETAVITPRPCFSFIAHRAQSFVFHWAGDGYRALAA